MKTTLLKNFRSKIMKFLYKYDIIVVVFETIFCFENVKKSK